MRSRRVAVESDPNRSAWRELVSGRLAPALKCSSSIAIGQFATDYGQKVEAEINRYYWQALELRLDPKRSRSDVVSLNIKSRLDELGRHASHASRQAKRNDKRFQLPMNAFFPIAITKNQDVRQFAPPLIDVQHLAFDQWMHFSRGALRLPRLSLFPSVATLRLALYIVRSFPAAPIVSALAESNVQVRKQLLLIALSRILSTPPPTFRLAFPSVGIEHCFDAVFHWSEAMVVATESIPDAYEEIFREYIPEYEP